MKATAGLAFALRSACPLGRALVVIVLSGCTAGALAPSVLSPWTMPQLPPPRVTPLPLTVGVYYSDSFKRMHPDDARHFKKWHQPGQASVELFESVLAATFERVVRIPTWPAEPPQDMQLVIAPRISKVSYHVAAAYVITYEISFLRPSGLSGDQWSVSGSSSSSYAYSSYETLYREALRAAAATLLVELRERPEVKMHLTAREPARFQVNIPMPQLEGNTLAIYGDSNWVGCLRTPLSEHNFIVRDVGFDQFRDAMFPWFEAALTPEGWQRMLGEPKARAAAAELGTRYVLAAQGQTTVDRRGAGLCGPYGCVGGSAGSRNTFLSIALVDFLRGELVAETHAAESGSSYGAVLGLIPITVATPTETRACQKTAAEIRGLVQGR